LIAGALWLGCASPTPEPEHVVLAPRAEHYTTPAAEEPIPDDPTAAYTLGFAWIHAGRSRDALRAFHRVIEFALSANTTKPRTPVRVEPGLTSSAALEGDKIAVQSEVGVVIASASTGALERLLPIPGVYEVDAMRGGIVAAMTTEGATLVSVQSAAIVANIPHAQAVRRAASSFAVYGTDDTGAFIELWDVSTHKRMRTLRDPSLQALMAVDFADGDRSIVASEGDHGLVWDVATGAVVLAFTAGVPGVSSLPGFSSDGRFIAYGSADMSKAPVVGTTFLFDRKQRRVVATSHASRMPCGFAFGDNWLAVGDMRKACLLNVPQMTRVGCSADVRPSVGPDDDLQDAHPTFVDSSHALAIQTSDSSVLVVKVPSMTTTWKGRASLAVSQSGTAYLFDVDNHELLSIGAGGVAAHIRPLAEEESVDNLRELHPHYAEDGAAYGRVVASTCHVGAWVFPSAACAGR